MIEDLSQWMESWFNDTEEWLESMELSVAEWLVETLAAADQTLEILIDGIDAETDVDPWTGYPEVWDRDEQGSLQRSNPMDPAWRAHPSWTTFAHRIPTRTPGLDSEDPAFTPSARTYPLPTLGDPTCHYNAHSPYLRCAINPYGPCEGCPQYQKQDDPRTDLD